MLLSSSFLVVLLLLLILHRPRSGNRVLVSSRRRHAPLEGSTGHLAVNCDLTSKHPCEEITRHCSYVQAIVIIKKTDWSFPPCVLASGMTFLFALIVISHSQSTTSSPIISEAPLIHSQAPLDYSQDPLDNSQDSLVNSGDNLDTFQDPAVKWSFRFLLPFVEISQTFSASLN